MHTYLLDLRGAAAGAWLGLQAASSPALLVNFVVAADVLLLLLMLLLLLLVACCFFFAVFCCFIFFWYFCFCLRKFVWGGMKNKSSKSRERRKKITTNKKKVWTNVRYNFQKKDAKFIWFQDTTDISAHSYIHMSVWRHTRMYICLLLAYWKGNRWTA